MGEKEELGVEGARERERERVTWT